MFLRKIWAVIFNLIMRFLWTWREINIGVVVKLTYISFTLLFSLDLIFFSFVFTDFWFLLIGDYTWWSVYFRWWSWSWLPLSLWVDHKMMMLIIMFKLILKFLIPLIFMVFYSNQRRLIWLFRYWMNLRVV